MSAAQDRDRLLRAKDVCAQTGLGRSTLYELSARGEFPQPVKLTAHTTAWPESEVQDWIRRKKEARRPGARS